MVTSPASSWLTNSQLAWGQGSSPLAPSHGGHMLSSPGAGEALPVRLPLSHPRGPDSKGNTSQGAVRHHPTLHLDVVNS